MKDHIKTLQSEKKELERHYDRRVLQIKNLEGLLSTETRRNKEMARNAVFLCVCVCVCA